jgi:hypothetical protein
VREGTANIAGSPATCGPLPAPPPRPAPPRPPPPGPPPPPPGEGSILATAASNPLGKVTAHPGERPGGAAAIMCARVAHHPVWLARTR